MRPGNPTSDGGRDCGPRHGDARGQQNSRRRARGARTQRGVRQRAGWLQKERLRQGEDRRHRLRFTGRNQARKEPQTQYFRRGGSSGRQSGDSEAADGQFGKRLEARGRIGRHRLRGQRGTLFHQLCLSRLRRVFGRDRAAPLFLQYPLRRLSRMSGTGLSSDGGSRSHLS